MKKILVTVAILLLLIVVGLPFVAGQKTEETLNRWVDQINKMGGYEVTWESYHKGWLSTDAVLKVGFNFPAELTGQTSPSEEWVIPLNLKVHHGPILWLDNLKLGWFSGKFFLSEEHQDWVAQNLTTQGDGPFFVSKIWVNLAGNATIEDRSLPFTVTKNDEVFSLTDYRGSGTVSAAGKLQYRGGFVSAKVESAKDNVVLEDVNFSLQSNFEQRVGQYVIPGTGEFSLKSAVVHNQEGKVFAVDNFKLTSSMAVDANQTTATVSFNVAFDNMELEQEKIADVVFKFNFDNLSLSFLNKYMEVIQNAYHAGNQPDPMIAMQMLGLVSSDLIPAGPQIRISEFSFKTPEGGLNFNGSVSVAPEAAQNTMNPLAMLSFISVDAAVVADKPLTFRMLRQSTLNELNQAQFEGGQQMTDEEKEALADNQTHMKLNMFTIQGMLVDRGEKYSAKFQFKNGAAVLNDKPMPMPF